ncbi:ATP-binding protein [Thermodesulfovibrio sp. 3907-1M]|uniref:endopeptidase La n=1 Tax=Thermodesulfovibrio autotrophicus TaxID=3118333 RepID=A0AAU8GX15_9BACT
MVRKLQAEEVYKKCEHSIFDFETTEELSPLKGTIGQDRAVASLEFGLNLPAKGFNIYALGEQGTGKMRAIRTLLSEKVKKEPVPPDWCYLYNFKNPDAPVAVSLPAGRATEFQKDMENLINTLKVEIPKAFESKEYDKQRNKILEDFQQKQREWFSTVEEEAKAKGFAIRKALAGLIIVPVKRNGEPLTEEEFQALDPDTRKRIDELGKMLQDKLDDVVRAVKEAEKIVKDMLARLERQIALDVIEQPIEELKKKYSFNEKIVNYLDAVKEDILNNIQDFKIQEEVPAVPPFMKIQREVSFAKYSVNVLVDNSTTEGAPVVYEPNPTYLNLFGRIEYKIQYGMAITDFTMIKPGSLHKANGGYLVIDAMALIKNLFSYDSLKRALRSKEIRIEDVWEQYRLITTTTLRPEPIPLNVKVILTGTPFLYYILYNYDEEYRELFKVKADFDIRMPRTEENIKKYAQFVSLCQKEEGLLPFHKSAVAKIVEYGSRLAEHQEKLSTQFSSIADLIRESHFWAKKDGKTQVYEEDVNKALEQRVYRSASIEEKLRELIVEDVLIVETSGRKVGQINGLAVIDLGDYSFGKPSRITARVYLGKAGIVNIERETKMSGKIHEKAVMILSSYLWSKYAIKKPISLSASLTFEQLYEMIEGDSATCAELYALLSSIAEIPLKQNIAVTGSMDQKGEVQPVGGINEKIEGFFELCKIRGLDGTHGVIIPRRNTKHLMLKEEIQKAIKDGAFHIYAIDYAEEGLEILTDMPAGELQQDGTYPEGTINYLVMKKLDAMSELLKQKEKEEEKKNEK